MAINWLKQATFSDAVFPAGKNGVSFFRMSMRVGFGPGNCHKAVN
jgi:hypothetical protein